MDDIATHDPLLRHVDRPQLVPAIVAGLPKWTTWALGAIAILIAIGSVVGLMTFWLVYANPDTKVSELE
jgi:hypothetical protein